MERVVDGEMTIDELGRRAGITTRNIRAYQGRGLLPPPRMAGRVALYGEGHLARLRYVARLQDQGFSLAGIGHLLKAWEEGRSISEVLGFEEAITAPWSDEAPEPVSRSSLEELFPEMVHDPSLLDRAVELGVLTPEGEDFRVQSPRLLQVGAELTAAGVPLAAVLDEHAELVAATDHLARRFVKLFETHVWRPFVAAGLPPDRLEEVTQTLHRLRPTASVAVQTALMHAMDRAAAASTGEEVRKLIFGEATGS